MAHAIYKNIELESRCILYFTRFWQFVSSIEIEACQLKTIVWVWTIWVQYTKYWYLICIALQCWGKNIWMRHALSPFFGEKNLLNMTCSFSQSQPTLSPKNPQNKTYDLWPNTRIPTLYFCLFWENKILVRELFQKESDEGSSGRNI